VKSREVGFWILKWNAAVVQADPCPEPILYFNDHFILPPEMGVQVPDSRIFSAELHCLFELPKNPAANGLTRITPDLF
jgi:hypothetical protein